MKRTFLALAGAAASIAAGSASAATIPSAHGNAALLAIRHAHNGCHTWERGAMPAKTAHAMRVHVGHRFMIVNRDSAAHTLVQTSGPVTVAPAVLARGSGTAITLLTPGTYTFRTEEAAHKMSLVDRLGDLKDMPDNVLTLKVVVASEYE
jgi:plastocyanin